VLAKSVMDLLNTLLAGQPVVVEGRP